MKMLKWTAEVAWYALTPEDDMAADQLADDFSDRLEAAITGMEGVASGTAYVAELDSHDDEENPDA